MAIAIRTPSRHINSPNLSTLTEPSRLPPNHQTAHAQAHALTDPTQSSPLHHIPCVLIAQGGRHHLPGTEHHQADSGQVHPVQGRSVGRSIGGWLAALWTGRERTHTARPECACYTVQHRRPFSMISRSTTTGPAASPSVARPRPPSRSTACTTCAMCSRTRLPRVR